MARSVSVPFNAQRVLYINLYDFENYFDQEYALDDFIQAICKRYPSLSPSRKRVGREDLGLAENAHAVVGVSTFCGLGAVWVTPKQANRTCCTWADSMKREFILGAVREHLGQPLRKIATASNEEAFFEAVND